jgi:hypothetical protein
MKDGPGSHPSRPGRGRALARRLVRGAIDLLADPRFAGSCATSRLSRHHDLPPGIRIVVTAFGSRSWVGCLPA